MTSSLGHPHIWPPGSSAVLPRQGAGPISWVLRLVRRRVSSLVCLTYTFNNRVGSLYGPGQVQGLLSQVLQLVGVRDSSFTLMSTETAPPPPVPGIDGVSFSVHSATTQMGNGDRLTHTCASRVILVTFKIYLGKEIIASDSINSLHSWYI